MATKLFDTVQTYAPVDNTPITPAAEEYAQISLAGATDNVPVTLPSAGLVGQVICLKCTGPAPWAGLPAIPFEFEIQCQGTNLKINGDMAFFVCTAAGPGASWELLWFEPGNPATVYEFSFTDADAGGAGVLVVPHRLNTLAPTVEIYDNTGALVQTQPGAAVVAVAVQVNNSAQLTVTLDPAFVPLAGNWRCVVRGGSTPGLS